MNFIIYGILTICFAIIGLYAVIGAIKCLCRGKWLGVIINTTLVIIFINFVINCAEKAVI